MPTKNESDHPEKSTIAMDAVEAVVVRIVNEEVLHVPIVREISLN